MTQETQILSYGRRARARTWVKAVGIHRGQIVWRHEADPDLTTTSPSLHWNADGSRGATAGVDYVYVWSMNAPRWVARFPHGRVTRNPQIAISADGKSLALSTETTTIAVWPDIDAPVRPAE